MIGLVFHITSEDMSATIGHKCNGTYGDENEAFPVFFESHVSPRLFFARETKHKVNFLASVRLSSPSSRIKHLKDSRECLQKFSSC